VQRAVHAGTLSHTGFLALRSMPCPSLADCGPSRCTWLSHAHSTPTAPPCCYHLSRKLAQLFRADEQQFPGSVEDRRYLTVGSRYTPTRYTPYRRWTRMASPQEPEALSDVHHFSRSISAAGTVHLSPSHCVSRLSSLRMRPTRVPLVALVRFRLAVGGSAMGPPPPRVPQASDGICFLVTRLLGQPRPRGDVGGLSSIALHSFSWRTYAILMVHPQLDIGGEFTFGSTNVVLGQVAKLVSIDMAGIFWDSPPMSSCR
jgi:hypothetical protein